MSRSPRPVFRSGRRFRPGRLSIRRRPRPSFPLLLSGSRASRSLIRHFPEGNAAGSGMRPDFRRMAELSRIVEFLCLATLPNPHLQPDQKVCWRDASVPGPDRLSLAVSKPRITASIARTSAIQFASGSVSPRGRQVACIGINIRQRFERAFQTVFSRRLENTFVDSESMFWKSAAEVALIVVMLPVSPTYSVSSSTSDWSLACFA